MTPFDQDVFRQILSVEGLSGPRAQNGRSLIFRCPQVSCGSKMVVDRRTGHFNCFKCGAINDMKGPAEKLLAFLLGCSVPAARARLYGLETTQLKPFLPDLAFDEDDEEEIEALPTRAWDFHMHPIDHPMAERGAAYLSGRGVPVEVAREYGIRYSPLLRQVLFPVEVDGRLVGWQGRLVVAHEWVDDQGEKHAAAKSPSSAGIPRDRVLMFQDRVRETGDAVLVEGPIDALKAHLVGGNVAAMGKTVTTRQLDVLRRKRVRRLYLGLDPDAAGELSRIIRHVAAEMEVYHLELPVGVKDLGELPIEAVPDVVACARRAYPWQVHVYFGGAAC